MDTVEKLRVLSEDSQYDLACAESHPEFYPVRINTSDKEALLRVPGLGPETVKRILNTRRDKSITRPEDIGIKGKRIQKIKSYVIFE
jgi:predicted DNA-binding helix-hairpin-helix protein